MADSVCHCLAAVLELAYDSYRSQSRANGSSGPQHRNIDVWLIEGSYTSDTRHLEKLAEKQNQHQKLVGGLELRGYDAKPMVFKQICWGWRPPIRGTSRNSPWRTCASQKKPVNMTAIARTSKELHLHSVTCATNIITQCRILDRQSSSNLLQTQKQPPSTTFREGHPQSSSLA